MNWQDIKGKYRQFKQWQLNPVKYVDPDGREWIVGGLASEMQIKKNKSVTSSDAQII